MHPDSQIFIPPSFIAVYSDARGRLQVPSAELSARYELCEDLANHLVDQAQHLHHGAAVPSEEEILRRMHAGLATEGSAVTLSEAGWIIARLAELLQWSQPELPGAPAAG